MANQPQDRKQGEFGANADRSRQEQKPDVNKQRQDPSRPMSPNSNTSR